MYFNIYNSDLYNYCKYSFNLLTLSCIIFGTIIIIFRYNFCKNKKNINIYKKNAHIKHKTHYIFVFFKIKNIIILLVLISYPVEYVRLYNTAMADKATIIAKVYFYYS